MESLRWLGLDWDGEVTYQLDRMERCREEAQRLVAEGSAYEDEGAIRIRMPDEGSTAWEDLVRGHIEVPSEKLEDLVAVRADGRPTYNFASPVEDWLDGITHVIRGEDHISNTPKQIRVLEALGAVPPAYAHLGNIYGPDGKKLSKRHGAVSVEEFRHDGYYAPALLNYLALLGWSYDDRTEIFSRDDLVRLFTLERVGASPAVFDYDKLNHLNGVYVRALSAGGVRGRAPRLAPGAGQRVGRGARPESRAARPGEDRDLRRVPGLRRLLLRPRRARPGASGRLGTAPRRSAFDAGRGRALRLRADRGGPARAGRAPGTEAAPGFPADPGRGHGIQRLAGALRVDRAPRPRGNPGAARRGCGARACRG